MSKNQLKGQLIKVLEETLPSVEERVSTAYDALAAPYAKSLVLFGAGGLGKRTLLGLRKIGLEPVAFTDNNPALWGKSVEGVQVLPLEEAARKFGENSVFVITIWRACSSDTMGEHIQQLRDLKCKRIVPFHFLYWKYPYQFLPFFSIELPQQVILQKNQVMEAFELWADDQSRQEFITQIKWRLFMNFEGLHPPVNFDKYFPHDLFTYLPDEVFVDGGAFDGDTIKYLLHPQAAFSGRIIAFEPDPTNYKKLMQYALSLPPLIREKLKVYPYALGDRRTKVRFDAQGMASSCVGTGDFEVEEVALDEILTGIKPTYIKMDIEGAEVAALLGARTIIKRDQPVLAICVYHQQGHLWQIPMLIQSFSEQYRFFLRPHDFEGWDLVCYAVPKNRLMAKVDR